MYDKILSHCNIHGKQGLLRGLLGQKRPIEAKEAYQRKRGLFRQKRPIKEKEAYSGKGGLLR
jgi:hypothetical protein